MTLQGNASARAGVGMICAFAGERGCSVRDGSDPSVGPNAMVADSTTWGSGLSTGGGYGADALADPLTEQARTSLREQAAAIAALARGLDEHFVRALRLLQGARGHVVVTGLGKSGLVGRKMAATFASTGTPSFFVHSVEAMHGDLGMVTDGDVVILISHSGETEEVTRMVPYLRRRGIPTVAMVGTRASTLGGAVDVSLEIPIEREICPNNLAPTTSTLGTLAMGDTLAVCLMRLGGFRARDFARLHPGGCIGRRFARVRDRMISEDLAVLAPGALLGEALLSLAESPSSVALVCEGTALVGLLQIADLRDRSDWSAADPVGEVMCRELPTVDLDESVEHAERRMRRESHRVLVAVDVHGQVQGLFEAPEAVSQTPPAVASGEEVA